MARNCGTRNGRRKWLRGEARKCFPLNVWFGFRGEESGTFWIVCHGGLVSDENGWVVFFICICVGGNCLCVMNNVGGGEDTCIGGWWGREGQ